MCTRTRINRFYLYVTVSLFLFIFPSASLCFSLCLCVLCVSLCSVFVSVSAPLWQWVRASWLLSESAAGSRRGRGLYTALSLTCRHLKIKHKSSNRRCHKISPPRYGFVSTVRICPSLQSFIHKTYKKTYFHSVTSDISPRDNIKFSICILKHWLNVARQYIKNPKIINKLVFLIRGEGEDVATIRWDVLSLFYHCSKVNKYPT